MKEIEVNYIGLPIELKKQVITVALHRHTVGVGMKQGGIALPLRRCAVGQGKHCLLYTSIQRIIIAILQRVWLMPKLKQQRLE